MQDAEDSSIRREDQKMRRMEMDAKLASQSEERSRQREMDSRKSREEAINARARGLRAPEGQDIQTADPNMLEWDPAYIQMQQQKAQAGAMADPFGTKQAQATNAKLETQLKTTEIKNKNRDEARKSLSPIEGYDKSDRYVGTPEEEKHLRSAVADLDSFNTTIDSLKQRVSSASKTDLANPLSDASKAIKNDLRDLQLIYKGKSFAELGVLAGPDMAILDQIVENPGTLSNLFSGKAGVLDRYGQAQQRVRSRFEGKAKALGLVKSGLVAEPKQGLVKAPPKAKPQTVIQNGVTYTLNPQTGEYE